MSKYYEPAEKESKYPTPKPQGTEPGNSRSRSARDTAADLGRKAGDVAGMGWNALKNMNRGNGDKYGDQMMRQIAGERGGYVNAGNQRGIADREMYAWEAQNKRAPEVVGAQSQHSNFRGNQDQLASMLYNRANGQGPSVADTAAKQTLQRGMGQQQAMAASARPGNSAMSARQASQQGSNMAGSVAGEAALGRAQESMTAANSLGNVLASARGQDERVNINNANMRQGASQANADAYLRNQAQNNQFAGTMRAQQVQLMGQQQAGHAAYNAQIGQRYNTLMGSDTDDGSKGGLGIIGSIASYISDKNLKKDIKGGEADVDEMLDKLKPYSYKYKDPKHGEGDQNSVMAQDLEKSKLGKKMVVNTSQGKVIDYTKALPTMLSALARMKKDKK